MWDDLTVDLKAKWIAFFAKNGIYKRNEVKDKYNLLLRINKSDADFVQRLKDPNRAYIQDWLNPDDIATHKMSWADDGVVYPQVLNVDGRLVDFSRPPYDTWAGYDNAIRNGDTIRMTPEEAEWFTIHYKPFYPGFNKYDSSRKFQEGGYTGAEKPRGYNVSSAIMNTVLNAYESMDNSGSWGDSKEPDNGMPQATFLMNRQNQKKAFEGYGYKDVTNSGYGIVNQAVLNSGRTDIPVYLKYKDAQVDLNDLLKAGYDYYDWYQNDYGPEKSWLVDPGVYPVETFVDSKTGKIYGRGWDYNDYDGVYHRGKSNWWNRIKNFFSRIFNRVGNPVVTTTGIQEFNGDYTDYDIPTSVKEFVGSKGLEYRDGNLSLPEVIVEPNEYGLGGYLFQNGSVLQTQDGLPYYELPEVEITAEPIISQKPVSTNNSSYNIWNDLDFISGLNNLVSTLLKSFIPKQKPIQYKPNPIRFENNLTIGIPKPRQQLSYNNYVFASNQPVWNPSIEIQKSPYAFNMSRLNMINDADRILRQYDIMNLGNRSNAPRVYMTSRGIYTPKLDFTKPYEIYSKGGHLIHINPANKGKFNATKKRTGKTTEELTHSKNPLTRKRAIFAQNAKKWHHKDNGGYLDDIIWDNMGLWSHPGRITGITGTKDGTDITMNGVADYLVGKDNLGNVKFMKPGRNYHFSGSSVVEYPLKYQFGGLFKKKPKVNYLYSTYGLNDYGQPRYEGSYNNPIFGYQPLSGINQSIGRDYSMPDYGAAAYTSYPIYMNEEPVEQVVNVFDPVTLRNRLMYAESAGNPRAKSHVGALGLFQIMPDTLKWYQLQTKDYGDVNDPVYNERVRDWLMNWTFNRQILKRDDIDEMEKQRLAYAAYNGGYGTISKAYNKYGNDWINHIPEESRNYALFIVDGIDTGGSRTNNAYDDWYSKGNKYIKQYGGLIKPFSYTDIPVVRYGNGGNLFLEDLSEMKVLPTNSEGLPHYTFPDVEISSTRLPEAKSTDANINRYANAVANRQIRLTLIPNTELRNRVRAVPVMNQWYKDMDRNGTVAAVGLAGTVAAPFAVQGATMAAPYILKGMDMISNPLTTIGKFAKVNPRILYYLLMTDKVGDFIGSEVSAIDGVFDLKQGNSLKGLGEIGLATIPLVSNGRQYMKARRIMLQLPENLFDDAINKAVKAYDEDYLNAYKIPLRRSFLTTPYSKDPKDMFWGFKKMNNALGEADPNAGFFHLRQQEMNPKSFLYAGIDKGQDMWNNYVKKKYTPVVYHEVRHLYQPHSIYLFDKDIPLTIRDKSKSVYDIANPNHPLYKSLLLKFDKNMKRGMINKGWTASPAEFDAEMGLFRLTNNLESQPFYNWDVDNQNKAVKTLSRRFHLNKDDTKQILFDMSKFGYF